MFALCALAVVAAQQPAPPQSCERAAAEQQASLCHLDDEPASGRMP